MTLITVQTYRSLTGDNDTPSPTVSARLEEAIELVEDFLGRKLESMERTEDLVLQTPDYRGYPLATPITDAGELTILNRVAVVGAPPIWPTSFWWDRTYPWEAPRATITYTGGFTEDTLPATLKRAICELAYALGQASSLVGASANIKSATVVGVSVTYETASGGESGSYLNSLVPGLTRRLKGYRHILKR